MEEPQNSRPTDEQANAPVAPEGLDQTAPPQVSQPEAADAPATPEVLTEPPAAQASPVVLEADGASATASATDGRNDAQREDLLRLSFDELVEALRQATREELTPARRQQVEDIRVAFYKNLRSHRENERRQWALDGGDPEAFEPSHIASEAALKEVLFAYRESRKAQAEAQEQERMANLAAKRSIIEKIRNLTTQAEVKGDTFREFDQLRREWKTIGFVPQAEADDLYNSYHHQVQNFYDYLNINRELRDLDYRKNLEEKLHLCEEAEDLIAHPDPIAAFKQLQTLHTQWKEIGPVMREKSEEIWERFSAASTQVNIRHRDHYESLRAQHEQNLAKKIGLCERVEAVNSTPHDTLKQWIGDTSLLVNIQKEWRSIGPVPKKHNNKIWVRFQAATEKFFTARREFERELKRTGQENIQRKQDLLAQAEGLKESTDWRKASQEMIDLQKQWKEVGYTPYHKGNELWGRFRAAMDYFFERRNAHSATERNSHRENLKAKEALLQELETYQIPAEPKEAVEWLKEIQTRWSAIGFVPMKNKESLQNRYRELLDKLYDALRMDRREHQIQTFRHQMEEMGNDGKGSNEMQRERMRLAQRMKSLEAERLQMETNLGFFTSSSPNNPILAQLENRLKNLQEEIDLMREKVKLLDRQSKAAEQQKA